jgi:hypothetical protein
MNLTLVGKTEIKTKLDPEIANLLKPGDAEKFLSEGVQHLKQIRKADTTSPRADIHPATKKFWSGVSNT